ncbi:MAG: discoidin domain-containing protein, partial [Armatimonadota bacterium]
DGSIDMWMASPGADGEWDWIRYRHSTDGGHTWTPDQIVLKPTPGSVDAYSVCDPGVIRFGGYYYIGYTSTANASGVENHVYIARSTSATGPWDKWNGTGWGGNPQPLLKYTGATGYWGCGEPSFVLKDGKLYIYYTWNDAGGYTDLAICDNPSADNWPANLTLYGHVIPRISGEDSTDVKYVDALGRFVGISTCDRMGNNATISVLQSADGISWERAPFRGTLAQCGTHNAGISGTETGHLDLSMNNFIAYAYQPPDGSWGNWPTHVDPISLTTVGIGSAVHANVTSILNDEYYTNAPRLDDGNLSTSWSSAAHTEPSATEWAGIDLGTSNTIRGLRITPGASCFPASFTLQYSHDGSTWYTIARQSYTGYSDPDGKPRIFQFFPAVTARYFRLNATDLTSDGSNYYLKLSEMETVINLYTDTTAPTGSISINSGAEGCYSRNVTLTLSAADIGDSGLWQMRFSNDNTIWSPWQAYATTANWTLASGAGVRTVYAQFADTACNTSSSTSDSINLLDVMPPLAGASTPPTSVTTDTIAVPYSGASDSESGLKQVELWFKKEAAGVWTNSGVTSMAGSGTFDFTPANGSGRYYFDLVVEDNAGNRSAAATGNGDGLTIFKLWWSDGFESNNFTAGGWANSGCTLQTAYKNTGTYAVQFNSSDILTKSFSTVGRTNVTVEYARYTRAMETDDHFICDWSINGTTWNTLEDLTGNSAWTAKAFSLPVAAENQSGFRVRFRTTHNTSTDYAYLDDVRIIGL